MIEPIESSLSPAYNSETWSELGPNGCFNNNLPFDFGNGSIVFIGFVGTEETGREDAFEPLLVSKLKIKI